MAHFSRNLAEMATSNIRLKSCSICRQDGISKDRAVSITNTVVIEDIHSFKLRELRIQVEDPGTSRNLGNAVNMSEDFSGS